MNSDNDKIRDATRRLERAVNDLATAAGDNAAIYVERAAARLRRRAHRERGDYHASPREPAWLWSETPRSPKLYRDAKRGKIFGVCAGIAAYYGLEARVVRCVAVTALIFLNWVAFVAYVVAAVILDKDPGRDGRRRHAAPPARSRHQRRPIRRQDAEEPSPSQMLRGVHAELEAYEQRLRHMETHVTSGQYELQMELARIDASKPMNAGCVARRSGAAAQQLE